MVQQQLVVGVLQCKGPDGKPHPRRRIRRVREEVQSGASSNAVELKSLVGRKKANLDVMVTEIANRTAQRPTQDPAFCSRHQRAFEWALLAEVTTFSQVPAPYDLGPEMKIFPAPRASQA